MKSKAIFLDRDGVINHERGDYVWLVDDLIINDGVVEFLQELRSRDYLFFIITNQSGISKELYTHEEVNEVHRYIKDHFASYGIRFTEIYYCPHHPIVTQCLCRKPGSLLVEKAVARFNIDPAQSYFIGDRERDIEAAKGAGVNPILIPSNAPLGDYLSMIA